MNTYISGGLAGAGAGLYGAAIYGLLGRNISCSANGGSVWVGARPLL